MPDNVTFRHAALNDAYARAAASWGETPEAQAKLETLATRLADLDGRTDLNESQLAQQARSAVTALAPEGPAGGPVLREPTGPGATQTTPSADPTLAPGVVIAARDGMPLVDGKRPESWAEAADAMYGLGTAIEMRAEGNLFSNLSLGQRKALLDRLEAMSNGSAFRGQPTDSLGADPAAQLRSCCATCLREVLASALADDTAEGRQLVARALNLSARLASQETHPGLRDSMVFGLYALQTELPAELKAVTRELMREVAPLTPDYETWLADGKVSMDYVVDGDWIDERGAGTALRGMGFTLVADSRPPTYRKTAGSGDKAALIEVTIRTNRTNMFDSVGKEGVDIVLYMGHSGYGRNIPRSISGRPSEAGADQLLMFGTCFGKDNLQHVRARYPEAEVMATFYSAYQWDVRDGMRALFDGIGGRKSWAAISQDIGGAHSGNWVTPAEVMLRRRILDRDGDGRADALDRLFDVNLQNVSESLNRAFAPRAPGKPPHQLQSINGVIAANWCNRGVGAYNEAITELNKDSKVACAGFFAGAEGDSPVRFRAATLPGGEAGWVMEINDQFAHVPEEALRVMAAYEFNAFLAANDERFDFHDDPLRARLNGLMAVAFTLSHDLHSHDTSVWRAFATAYGFPAELSLHEVESFAQRNGASDRDVDAGCKQNIDAMIAELERTHPELLETLRGDGVGSYRAAR